MLKRKYYGLFFIAIGIYHLGNRFTIYETIRIKAISHEIITVLMLIATGVILIWQWKIIFSGNNLKVSCNKTIIVTLGTILFIREFISEPFRITSRSMVPTLHIGDYVLVLKYAYGYRIPFSHEKIFMFHKPERGDLIVFNYASDSSRDYIKRVVGIPGDTVTYNDNRLVINGLKIETKIDGINKYQSSESEIIRTNRFIEYLGPRPHLIVDKPVTMHAKNLEWIVSQNHYFVLGDNRDASNDSRFLGQVPAYRIAGKVKLF